VDGDGADLELDGKAVFEALRGVAQSFPDVRVFNLSFGSYVALGRLRDAERLERHVELQDLDNLAFEHDIIIVVAAGNTQRGVVPNTSCPGHVDDPDWGLGAWAAGFNTLVVGGYVPRVNTDGVAKLPGWPSPFTRIGPGVARAPVPNYSAGAGDCTDNYQWAPGLGVATLNKIGLWEGEVGTSHAAPIVAREAAILFSDLEKYCERGVPPFASTVKAFLRLVARPEAPPETLKPAVRKLARRTLGQGRPSADRLNAPRTSSAVFLWQGTLEAPGVAARVRVLIPRSWARTAKLPKLRAVCAWNTPVCAAAPELWACRKVSFQLRPDLDSEAPHGHGRATGSYPLIDKTYDLHEEALRAQKIDHAEDEWILEVSYEEVGPYPAQMTVADSQRVSLAWELYDADEGGVSPQAAIQSTPLANTMISLGGAKQPIWAPIKIPLS
jgi:hypothetical protein